jgi:hypothetical protein
VSLGVGHYTTCSPISYDSASPRVVFLPHVALHNLYLHLLGSEAATSPVVGTLSLVKPASPTERGKGVLIASYFSLVVMDHTRLARLMYGLSPQLSHPSLGPPEHPSSPSTLSQPRP